MRPRFWLAAFVLGCGGGGAGDGGPTNERAAEGPADPPGDGVDAAPPDASDPTDAADVKTETPAGDIPPSPAPQTFGLFSARATRIEVYLYDRPFGADERLRRVLDKGAEGRWSTTISAEDLTAASLTGVVYYGYRVWGPNWPYVPSWRKGTLDGFVADVDADGNRFNPNKLLLDPYAREMSHDPVGPSWRDGGIYASGPTHRQRDSGPAASKGILLQGGDGPSEVDVGTRPVRALKDEVIYEVHVRGLTMADPSVPPALRGTYAGAALKADFLRALGVTAIELLPIHETQNDQNDIDVGTGGDNYWGYSTLSFFAPDRRYAHDRSPGGPTRELRAMVKAFHDRGIKVYLDVVYNHTGEGGVWNGSSGDVASLLSFRGIDNATYYELTNDGRFYYDNTGVGGNVNAAEPAVRDLIIDSLRYWSWEMGMDGFRFDLASVLGNACKRDCFRFDKLDPGNALNRAVRELPARPVAGGAGVDLIAEPWAIGGDSYQVGGFPSGWAEWNGMYRDTVRRVQNKLGIDRVTMGQLAARLAGSSDLYGDDGRRPAFDQLRGGARRLFAARPLCVQQQGQRPVVAVGSFGRRRGPQQFVGSGRGPSGAAASVAHRPRGVDVVRGHTDDHRRR